MWIILIATTLAGCIFVGYLLHKAGEVLQAQEERDTQSNYEYLESDDL
jgi:hypothetical protein